MERKPSRQTFSITFTDLRKYWSALETTCLDVACHKVRSAVTRNSYRIFWYWNQTFTPNSNAQVYKLQVILAVFLCVIACTSLSSEETCTSLSRNIVSAYFAAKECTDPVPETWQDPLCGGLGFCRLKRRTIFGINRSAFDLQWAYGLVFVLLHNVSYTEIKNDLTETKTTKKKKKEQKRNKEKKKKERRK